MNKLYITTALILTSVTFVGAQEYGIQKQIQEGVSTVRKIIEVEKNDAPKITTGDTNVDNQIRALNKEMEEKIKTIRDEYQTKIRAILSERKATIMASTTQRVMMQGENRGLDEGRKMGVPFNENEGEDRATSRPMMEANQIKEQSPQSVQDVATRLRDLFRGFFGRGN